MFYRLEKQCFWSFGKCMSILLNNAMYVIYK